MIQAKQELLAALAAALGRAGARAARLRRGLRVAQAGRPRRPGHHRGDAAGRAAEEEPARAGRRRWSRRCSAQPAVQRWVQALEIAGPGFINLRLTRRGQAGRGGRGAGRRRRASAASRPTAAARDGRVRLGQPDRPAARGPRPPGGAGRLRSATCSRRQGWQVHARVLLQRRRRADRHAGRLDAGAAAAACKPGDARLARDGLQRRLHRRHRRRLRWPARPCTPTTASSPPRGDADDLDGIRQFAVAYLRHEQDLDLQAFGVRFDHYFLESQPVHRAAGSTTRCSAWSPPARPTRKAARCGCAPPTTATTRTA